MLVRGCAVAHGTMFSIQEDEEDYEEEQEQVVKEEVRRECFTKRPV